MKKTNKLFLIAGFILALAGCSKTVEVTLSKASADMNPAGDTLEVALTSNGEWSVNTTAEWLSVSPLSGSGDATLTIVAAENTTSEARSAKIEVTTKDKNATLDVTQDLRGSFIQVVPTRVECAFEGGQVHLSVRSNIDWAVSELPDWISSTPITGNGDAVLTLTIAEWDDESNSRQAIITIGSETLSTTAEVVQNPKPSQQIAVDPDFVEFEYNNTETKTLSVTCSGSWTVECEADWVVLSATSGQSDAEILVSVAENVEYYERAIKLLFVSEFGTEARVRIIQNGAPNPHFLNLDPMETAISGTGGNVSVGVECDSAWTVVSTADWMTIETNQGYGNGSFTVVVEANPLVTPRRGNIKVVSGNLIAYTMVNQAGIDEVLSVVISPESLEVPKEGGLRTLEITANVAWRLQSSPWITLLAPTGTGNGTSAVAVDANNTYETRTGYVRAYFNNELMDEIEVTQEGIVMTIEADPTEINATASAGKYMVNITANQNWRVVTQASWIVLDPIPNQESLLIGVLENTTSNQRTAEVRVIGAQHGHVIITVNQAAN